MSPSMSTFTTFMNVTGPSFVTGPEQIVNEAVKQTYLLGRFLRDADLSKTLQGGSDIRDSVMFDEQSTFTFYSPNATFTPTNPQVVTNWKAYWRFGKDELTWTDQEIELQVPDGLTAPARHQIYKRVKWSKEQRMWTSMLNGMEDALWTPPETADMEAETGLLAYSIPAFVNEWSNGLFYSRTGGSTTGKTVWTTKQTIDPTIHTRWKSQLNIALPDIGHSGTTISGLNLLWSPSATEGPTGTVHVEATRGLLQTFDVAWQHCKFIPPPTRQQYFENPAMYKQFVACSFSGQALYMDKLRLNQDTFVTRSRQDPAYIDPAYAGIDVLRIAALNDAQLYPNDTVTSAPVDELDTSVEDLGQRFYMLNGNYICPVFHTSRYMKKHPALRHRDQPFTWVQYVDTWYNIVARSLQRHALIHPKGA